MHLRCEYRLGLKLRYFEVGTLRGLMNSHAHGLGGRKHGYPFQAMGVYTALKNN